MVAHSPESNSPVERFHRSIKRVFMAMVATHETDVAAIEDPVEREARADQLVLNALCKGLISLNSLEKGQHGLTAYEMFFNRTPATHEPTVGMAPESMVEDIRRKRAADHAARAAEQPQVPLFEVGDHVMLLNSWRRSSCAPHHIGPFEVVGVRQGSPFVVIAGANRWTKVVRVSHVTKFTGPAELAENIPGSAPPLSDADEIALAEEEMEETRTSPSDTDFLDPDMLLDMVDDFVVDLGCLDCAVVTSDYYIE